jgi:hypothetical protein
MFIPLQTPCGGCKAPTSIGRHPKTLLASRGETAKREIILAFCLHFKLFGSAFNEASRLKA